MAKSSQLGILSKVEKAANEKKSRFLIISVLALTIIPSLFFWLITGFKNGQVKFLDSFANSKVPNLQMLNLAAVGRQSALGQWSVENISPLPGDWSIKVISLSDNFTWSFNAGQVLTAASLIKLPIVASFYHEVESGVLNLDDAHVLTEFDIRSGAGILQYRKAGTRLNLGEIASLALSQSDNTAANILQNLVGKQEINRLIDLWGMKQTSLADNLTSADDISLFFKKFYQGDILGTEYSERMLNDMIDTAYENRIPAGVPEGIMVAHKVGTEDGVVSDAGIVLTPDNPFVLVFMSDRTDIGLASEIFPKMVEDIYWFVIND